MAWGLPNIVYLGLYPATARGEFNAGGWVITGLHFRGGKGLTPMPPGNRRPFQGST